MPSLSGPVLFDLDGTLVEYERDTAALLDLAFEASGVEPFFDVSAYHARFEEFLADSDGMADLRERCFAAIAAERGRDPSVGRAVASAYAAERDHSRVRALAGARDLVASLADRPRGLVTNGAPAGQRQKLAAVGLADAFDVTVFAGHDAAPKPDPEPFEVALDALGVTPDECVYVGNSLDHDVAGAHAAGLTSVWVHGDPGGDPDPEPHHACADLHAVRDLLWASTDEPRA